MAQSAGAAKLQPITRPQDLPRAALKQTPEVKTDLSANIIATIALDPNLKDEVKVTTLTKTITSESLRDLQSFGTYLAQRRTLAQRRLLELTSTTAFPRLQSVIGSLQGGVVDFDKMMQPMVDDLQAAFDLRTNNQMNNAMREISEDRAREADWETRRVAISGGLKHVHEELAQQAREVVRLEQDKTIFGNVRGSALVGIHERTVAMTRLKEEEAEWLDKQALLKAEQAEVSQRTGEFKAQKERLRKMLDLGPGYVKRVEEIVAKAISFIDDSTNEVGAIRGEFGDLEEQSRNVLRANAQMMRVTAILDRSIDGANQLHKDKVRNLSVVPEDEDALARVTRTQEKNDLERFVSALSETSVSTKKNVSALEEDAVGANNFNSVVMKQQMNLRELHGDGIASITTNLNMTLQGFNTAALTEAGNNAWQAIGDMNRVTNKIRDNQVVASGMSLDDTNQRIIERFDSLAGVSDALQRANKLRADGISNIASSLKELADKTAEVQKNLQVNIGLDASGPDARVGPDKPIDAKRGDDLMLGV